MLSLFLLAGTVAAAPPASTSSKSEELQTALQQEMDTLAAKTGFALQLVRPSHPAVNRVRGVVLRCWGAVTHPNPLARPLLPGLLCEWRMVGHLGLEVGD